MRHVRLHPDEGEVSYSETKVKFGNETIVHLYEPVFRWCHFKPGGGGDRLDWVQVHEVVQNSRLKARSEILNDIIRTS